MQDNCRPITLVQCIVLELGLMNDKMRFHWTHLSWSSTLKSWRKFPPKTRESIWVTTAWIHPVGMNRVWPCLIRHLENKINNSS